MENPLQMVQTNEGTANTQTKLRENDSRKNHPIRQSSNSMRSVGKEQQLDFLEIRNSISDFTQEIPTKCNVNREASEYGNQTSTNDSKELDGGDVAVKKYRSFRRRLRIYLSYMRNKRNLG